MQQAKNLFRSENHKVGHKPERLVVRKAGNIIDVFHGQEGFRHDEWTRFVVVKIKTGVVLKFLKGATMSKEMFTQLLDKFKEAN